MTAFLSSASGAGTNSITLNTTGARSFAILVSGQTPNMVPTSSLGGTIVSRPFRGIGGSSIVGIQWHYILDTTLVGAGHVFSCGSSVNVISVLAFDTPLTFENEVFFDGASTTSQAVGSLTPAGASRVMVAGAQLPNSATGVAVSDSYTLHTNLPGISGTRYGGATAYRIDPPGGAALNPTISWTSAAADVVGAHMMFLGTAGGDTTPPTITSASSFSVAENTTTVATLTANETVTWAKTGGADQALFMLDSSTGALAFASGRDFENPSDADANNVYVVQVTATDLAANASTPQTISVTVTNVTPETVPGTPGGMVSISNPSATATVVVGSATDATSYEARINDGLGGAFGAWTAFGTTTTTWTGIVLGRTYAIEWRGINGIGTGASASGTFRVEQGAPSSSGGTFIAALLAVLNP